MDIREIEGVARQAADQNVAEVEEYQSCPCLLISEGKVEKRGIAMNKLPLAAPKSQNSLVLNVFFCFTAFRGESV